MRNTWIRRISAIRKDGVESAINLTCGLNCIIGASNTGKTRIAKTVEFAGSARVFAHFGLRPSPWR